YIDDVARGLANMALAPGVIGRTVDLGSGSTISTADLVTRICELMESQVRPIFARAPDRPLEVPRMARIDETCRLIDWSPTVSLGDGLRRTMKWYHDVSSDPPLRAAML